LFLTSTEVESACGNKERFDLLKSTFNHHYNTFANEHVIDTYVFCLSEHVRDDTDGLLSMWRGYGGNGTGAAVVFDAGKLSARDGSPLIVARVKYAPTEERTNWLQQRTTQFAQILGKSSIPDDKLYRGFWSEVQQVYEKRICTSLPSSLRIAWNGVLKPRHFLGVRLAVRTMSCAFRVRFSKSFAKRRQRLSHAKVRSTTQRRGRSSNPLA
jgi:hypothetical protein